MDVVVTGAAGFIGSHVVEELVRRGHTVRAVDCMLADSYAAAAKRESWRVVTALPGVTALELDLRTADLEPVVAGADLVVNEAGIAGMVRSWAEIGLYMDLNVTVVGRLAEACLRTGVTRLVQASTSSVYGTHADGDESHPLLPASPYGVSNVAAEELLRAYERERGLAVTVLRYFSVYGPRQRPDMAYHRFIEAILDGRPVTMYGDGSYSRSTTFVADAARATASAAERGEGGATFNVAGGEVVTVAEAIDLIARTLGIDADVVHLDPPFGEQVRTSGSWLAAAHALGYSPATAVADGIAEQVRWHLERRAG
ncbi:NAD-dependent epimerase/dehydratase family protein [Cellulomonas rhizosphaerae]|uniref:NAD-dependent epimerase/dehydratase family protein n=1 Tax=Cellulomonas rhizosphaerae TaxID=2293719 RepID=A0A413RJT2_9CELL|nr:NAD-dependent epimerase/dehydratase family protein [Cellulomonas rhizosphaerae]RHA38902.1 NAD-dependent epimerase/dehydratase family protein [Cellulomonas rhizosphaerae]